MDIHLIPFHSLYNFCFFFFSFFLPILHVISGNYMFFICGNQQEFGSFTTVHTLHFSLNFKSKLHFFLLIIGQL